MSMSEMNAAKAGSGYADGSGYPWQRKTKPVVLREASDSKLQYLENEEAYADPVALDARQGSHSNDNHLKGQIQGKI